ncbi:MAG: 5'-nucleotidase C-terminal domain-containing protein [Flavobacteriaceae bacterium]
MKKIFFVLFTFIIIVSCNKVAYKNTKIVAKTIPVDSLLKTDSIYTNVIAPYREKMIHEISKVISYTPKNLVRTDGNMQSTLGNLMADLCYKKGNSLFKKAYDKEIDFALFNYGGIRSGIFKGDVTNRNVFQLMPFENTFVVVELSGEKVEELIRYFINNKRAHPLSKEIQLTIKKDGYSLLIRGKAFDKTKTYHVLTHNYLQSGGDRMDFFKEPIKLYALDYKVRDAIASYFKSVDTLYSKLDNRVIFN